MTAPAADLAANFGDEPMDNLAPAIQPPKGIGDSKPNEQTVLDWVQEVARRTQPENIFWCDGSEKENDYLLGEAQRQGADAELRWLTATRDAP